MTSLLAQRRGLIVGVANHRSIATGIARAAAEQGARLALTYQSERLRSGVESLAGELGAEHTLPCDVTQPEQVQGVVDALGERWGALDFMVHAVAFAERQELEGRFLDTSREGFRVALEVSVYSLVELVRAAEPLLRAGANPSVLTLSYLGGERAVPNYNVMGVAKAALESAVRYLAAELGPSGIRVNALSPGPIKTLSAAGVRGLRRMLEHSAAQSPLRRNVTSEDVGRAALPLLSHLGSGITGEVIHVDGGYHIVGAPREQA